MIDHLGTGSAHLGGRSVAAFVAAPVRTTGWAGWRSRLCRKLSVRCAPRSSPSLRLRVATPSGSGRAPPPLTAAIAGTGAISAVFGPLLDALHTQYGVLVYHHPTVQLDWGAVHVATAWWAVVLFAAAGAGIAGLALHEHPPPPSSFDRRAVAGTGLSIILFTLQYAQSAWMAAQGTYSPTVLVMALGVTAMVTMFTAIGASPSAPLPYSRLTAAAAVAGPLVELVLIRVLHLYHYARPDWQGIPWWIVPLYATGSVVVGRLAATLYSAMERVQAPSHRK
ncbi:hypothetical protein CDCA_CDCA07G2032 [Cyanidium caldarium]|uniref:Integral membrane protein n=1 Tax=Cyanidium caldarium TaxID=2771 RepID=A0AAV9IUK7_CYACA|nr:hypothetical protein CDCA_CDCA07G2032 [Cyanidium caldarium]